MDKLGGMFRNASAESLNLPNDSQCPTCLFFDVTRLDVLDILDTAIRSGGKYKNLTVAWARCKCGVTQTQGRMPYKD